MFYFRVGLINLTNGNKKIYKKISSMYLPRRIS